MDARIIAVISAIAVIGVAAVFVVPSLLPDGSPGSQDPVTPIGPLQPDTSMDGLIGTWTPIAGYVVSEDGTVADAEAFESLEILIPDDRAVAGKPLFRVESEKPLFGVFETYGSFLAFDEDIGQIYYSVISNHGYLVMYSLYEVNDVVEVSVKYFSKIGVPGEYTIGEDGSLTVSDVTYLFAGRSSPMQSGDSWSAYCAEKAEPKLRPGAGENPYVVRSVLENGYRISDVSYIYGVSKTVLAYTIGIKDVSETILAIPTGRSAETGAYCDDDGFSAQDIVYSGNTVTISSSIVTSNSLKFLTLRFDADGTSTTTVPAGLSGTEYGKYSTILTPMGVFPPELHVTAGAADKGYMYAHVLMYLLQDEFSGDLLVSYTGFTGEYHRMHLFLDIDLGSAPIFGMGSHFTGEVVCYVSEDLSRIKLVACGDVGMSLMVYADQTVQN